MTTDTDRLAALLHNLVIECWPESTGDGGCAPAYHRDTAIALSDAGVTLKPAAPAEGLTCPHGAEWDGRIWTKVKPAAPAEGLPCHCVTKHGVRQPTFGCPIHRPFDAALTPEDDHE